MYYLRAACHEAHECARSGWVSMIDDNGHRSAVANEAREAERLVRLAQFSTDHAVDAVFWIGPTAEILYVNDAGCRCLGYPREELVGKTVPEIDPHFPKDAWSEHWAELKRRGSFSFESAHQTKDGRTIETEVTVNFVLHEGHEYNCAIMRDITARKRTEAQLHQQVERLSILNTLATTLNASADLAEMYQAAMDSFRRALAIERMAILVSDSDGVGRFRAWRGLSDRYRHAVEGHSFWGPNDPEPRPVVVASVADDPVAASLRAVILEEGILAFAAVPLSVKGRLIGKCMLYFDAPRCLAEEEVQLAQTIAEHVAFAVERKRSEAAVWRSSQLLLAIVEGTPDAVYVKDRDGRYLLFNRAAGRFVGKEPGDVLGLDDTALFSSHEARAVMHGDRGVMETGAPGTYHEWLTTADGLQRVFHSTKGPLFDENGAVTGLFGIARDITEQQAAEEKVRQGESRFRALVHYSSDITTILSADGTIRYQSPAFYRLLGWTEAEVIGRSAFDLVHPEDRAPAMEAFAQLVADPASTPSVEFRFRKSDGAYVTLQAIGNNSLNDPDVAGIIINSRDVTERNRLAEQLRHASKMEAIGRLAGGIAHDFNNLLTVICGNSDVALREHDLADELREAVEEVRKAGERAAQLTRQLLAFGRRRAFEPKAVDVNATVSRLTTMLRRLIGEDIRLDVVLNPGLGLVRVDGDLEQVVMNLAINARDAMPAGGTLFIETASPEDSGLVLLTVRDTGCGMDADVLSHIFEPFFTTKGPGQGTGLGLSTVYGIVTQSGAAIDVRSRPGEGTTFAIAFPGVSATAHTPEPGLLRAPEAVGAETVLLVEDEEMVRRFTRRVLTERGYRVLEASSAEDALQHYGNGGEGVHLLLTDIVMPGMNGRALAERMLDARPALKVLFMSGYTDMPALRDTRWDSSAFLEKPFTPETLGRVVRAILDAPPGGEVREMVGANP